MTVQSVVYGTDPEVLKVALQDGSVFFIRISYLSIFGLDAAAIHGGAILNEDEAAAFERVAACSRAEASALQLIARQEQSVVGLNAKLKRRGFDDEIVGPVLDRLAAVKLVDDERYSRAWLASRMAKKAEGRFGLLAGLRRRGIARSVAESAIAASVGPEREAALLERYLGTLNSSARLDPRLRQRLKARGFTSACVNARFGVDGAELDLIDSSD